MKSPKFDYENEIETEPTPDLTSLIVGMAVGVMIISCALLYVIAVVAERLMY
jgi:hypothetical protein